MEPRNSAPQRAVLRERVVPPGDVARAIEAALARNAPHEPVSVHVDVVRGWVRLTGRVHSWIAWQTVREAAARVPGVRIVEDHIQIEPGIPWSART
jgi:osmotically-inducible protein OsmY